MGSVPMLYGGTALRKYYNLQQHWCDAQIVLSQDSTFTLLRNGRIDGITGEDSMGQDINSTLGGSPLEAVLSAQTSTGAFIFEK